MLMAIQKLIKKKEIVYNYKTYYWCQNNYSEWM